MQARGTTALSTLVLTALVGGATGANAATAAASVTSGRLVLVRAGNLWTVTDTGAGRVQLTTGGHDSRPRYSPDGKRIAFVRTGADGLARLWIMRQDGSGAQQVSRLTNVGRPDWAPDGKSIAFIANTNDPDPFDAVYRLNAVAPYSTTRYVETGNVYEGPHDPSNVQAAYSSGTYVASRAVSYSPDGKNITYSQGVCTAQFAACMDNYDPTTGWTTVAAVNEPYPTGPNTYSIDELTNSDWSPDSTTLLAENTPKTGPRYLQMLSQTGAPTIKIANAYAGAYAPGGTKIVFGRTIAGVASVMIANTNGTGQVRITNGTSPDWQPVEATGTSLVPASPSRR